MDTPMSDRAMVIALLVLAAALSFASGLAVGMALAALGRLL